MLPSLILRWAITDGSNRVSLNDEAPPLLLGGFPPPAMKLLTAALRLYSSSTSRLFLLRMNKNAPPAIAAIATIPTTTPAAMPALLGLPELLAAMAVVEVAAEALDVAETGPAVTTTVSPGRVTNDGVADLVDDGVVDPAEEELELEESVSTFATRPLI